MGYVHGHWRETGWVRGHFRHPLRPGTDQTGLVFLVASPVRIDLSRHPGAGACCRLADRPGGDRPARPGVPGPRPVPAAESLAGPVSPARRRG